MDKVRKAQLVSPLMDSRMVLSMTRLRLSFDASELTFHRKLSFLGPTTEMLMELDPPWVIFPLAAESTPS